MHAGEVLGLGLDQHLHHATIEWHWSNVHFTVKTLKCPHFVFATVMINVAQLQSSHNRATSHPGQCCTIFDGNTMVNDAGALPRNNRKERGETHCPHSRSRIHSKTMETLQCNAREALKLLMGHLLEFLAWVDNLDFPKLIATRPPYHIRFDHWNILFLFDIVFKSYLIS